jgi:uncharacterized protein with gpF-like domain
MAVKWGNLPFKQAIDFFRKKLNMPTNAWYDVYGAAHEKAFMIAGATKADLLSDMRAAVDEAIAEGTTIEAFRKAFDSIVETHGWSYKGGRNWRTRVIYHTNVRQAYNAGREIQMNEPALRERRPYGLYRVGFSKEHRPEHLEKDNMVVPLDSTWWDYWTPQNGWGCNCKKFALSARDVERRGLTVTDAPDIPMQTVEIADGRQVTVPVGIDPGFDYRPGVNDVERMFESLSEKAARLRPEIGMQLQADLTNRPKNQRPE